MVDAVDSKSTCSDAVEVRVLSPVPVTYLVASNYARLRAGAAMAAAVSPLDISTVYFCISGYCQQIQLAFAKFFKRRDSGHVHALKVLGPTATPHSNRHTRATIEH